MPDNGQSPNSVDPYPLWTTRIASLDAGSRARQAIFIIRDNQDDFHLRVIERASVQRLATPIRNRLLALEDDGHLLMGPGSLQITTNGRRIELSAVPDKAKWDRFAKYVKEVEGRTREKKIRTLSTLVRDGRVRTIALECFGRWCQVESCEFTQQSVRKTIEKVLEVHHLQGVGSGGSDSLFNLSVLCANHHRLFDRLPGIIQIKRPGSDDLILRHRDGDYHLKRDLSEIRKRVNSG